MLKVVVQGGTRNFAKQECFDQIGITFISYWLSVFVFSW